MPRFTNADTRRVREIEQSLRRVQSGRTAVLDSVLPQLRELLGGERLVAYGVSDSDPCLRLDFMAGDGFDVGPLAREVSGMLGSGERRWGFYDPCRPEPKQRNRAVFTTELASIDEIRRTRMWSIFQRLGLGMQQLRVLVCDGPAMLAWIGIFCEAPLGARERRLLQAVTPALQERLRLEEQVARAPLALAALGAALELLPGAAFVSQRNGHVVYANGAARAQLETDRRGLRDRLRDAIERGGTDRLQVTALAERGAPEHHLVVEQRGLEDPGPRVAELVRRYQLTPRQSAVLALLVDGESNKTIAARLYCAERTVEAHVTAMLARVGVSSRAELVGRVWRRS